MKLHICTRESFMTDTIKTKGFCLVCCKENQLTSGWIETKCEGCNSYFSLSALALNDIVWKRRKLLGLTRKEMAEKTRLATQTISKYENVWPSKRYLLITQQLMEGKDDSR